VKSKGLIAAIVLGLGLALALLWLVGVGPARADAGTRYVGTTGSDVSNDCTNPGHPCATLQRAIDVAQPGDEVRVTGGAYARVGTLAAITWVGSYVALTLTNNLIAGHTVGITNTAPASSTIVADMNLSWNILDPIVGAHSIRQDPLLTADYHLRLDSPAVDAGLTIPWLAADLDGNPRPRGARYDVGAFEAAVPQRTYLPLVFRNAP